VPVSNSDRIDAHVTEIIPRGEFATWQAARVVGDDDLNTFLFRIDRIGDATTSLEPGMTVSATPASP
jgi:HlyD family secretion protein